MYNPETGTTIFDRREMLRVKVKSLALEAQVIKREEFRQLHTRRGLQTFTDYVLSGGLTPRKLKELWKASRRAMADPWLYRELHEHRVHQVRGAARLAHLAYGAVRGVPLEKMEDPKLSKPLTTEEKRVVLRMFKQYGAAGAEVPAWMHEYGAPAVVQVRAVA